MVSMEFPQIPISNTTMKTHPFQRWSNDDIMTMEENNGDPFSTFPSHFDFPSQYSGFLDSQLEMPIQETAFDALPVNGIYPNDPFQSWQSFGPSDFHYQGQVWNEALIYKTEEVKTGDKKKRRRRDEYRNNSTKSLLSKNTISKYFYLPITQAAKELNIGVTLLKKRCRELGIQRWPHRKLMSLQTLINNVQQMEKEGVNEMQLREYVKTLEHEKKLIEEIPDLQIEDNTKRLRQACFKANYKKRKMMGGMTNNICSQSSSHSNNNNINDASFDHGDHAKMDNSYSRVFDEEEEEIKSLLADCFSSSNDCLYF